MRRTLFPVALLLGACAMTAPPAPAQGNAQWAQFRGPAGMGVSSARGVPASWGQDRGIVWKTPLEGAGTSSPVVFNNRIYLTAYTGSPSGGLKLHLLCLNLADGKQVWAREIQPQLPEQDRIREDHGWASSTVAVDADRIFAFFGKTGVFAFDHSGKEIWRANVGTGLNGWGSSNSPVLFRNLVIINASVESESLVALDRATGREVWRAGGIKESWNTPILVQTAEGRTELALAIVGQVLGFDPTTGQRLWNCATDIAWYMVPSLVSRGGVVYCIGGRTAGALAVRTGGRGDVTGTHRVWTLRKGSNVSSPVLVGDHLYWVHENLGIAYCAELATGRLVYEERLGQGGQFYASALAVDGKLLYISRDGRCYTLPVGPTFQPPQVSDLRDRGVFNASPAVAGNRLLIRSDRFLYLIGS